MNGNHRKPAAFVLDDEDKPKSRHKIEFDEQESVADLVTLPQVPRRTSKGFRWGFVLVSALTGLLSLWAGLTITTLIEDFFARSTTLGWLATSIASLAGLAAFAIIFREIWSLARLRRIEHIQEISARAVNFDEATAATETIVAIESIYRNRSDTAWGMKVFRDHSNDIMDPRDRIKLLDRVVIKPPIEIAPELRRDDAEATIVRQFASQLESVIRRAPHQWFCFGELWPTPRDQTK